MKASNGSVVRAREREGAGMKGAVLCWEVAVSQGK